MNSTLRKRSVLLLFVVFSLASPGVGGATFLVESVGGNNTTASIQGTVDAFRADLGNPNNMNNPGPLSSGRREINWDGGGGATTVSPTPFTGFGNIRGAVFATPGTGFVQAPVAGLAATFNATYSSIFSTFSPQRLFTASGSNITDVTFFVPGTSQAIPATVRGFGAVFTDVDLGSSTRIQFFDIANNELFNQNVLAGTVADGSLSFLGATANAGERIFRVRITSGNTALGPNDDPTGLGVDIVAMDDFLYAEPQAIPEPTSLLLLGSGLVSLGGIAWRRRKS